MTNETNTPSPAQSMSGRKAGPGTYRLAKHHLSSSENVQMERLLELLRQRRVLEEAKFSDAVVVWASKGVAHAGPERATLSAIRLGKAGKALRHEASAGPPEMDVLRRIEEALVMQADSAALLAMRQSTPGLRMAPVAWAYPQYIRPMGDELDSAAIQVAPGTKVRQFDIRFADAEGRPVAGVKVKALVDWDGANVSAITNSEGIATLGIPVAYPRVELILIEPEHTYWSVFAKGFDRTAAPAQLAIPARPLAPDGFHLLSQYAPYDALAGQGVTVGVIDSGVGPHAQLAVAGGACLVTGEDEADFLDNGIGHGTHVAGTIAATLAEGTGIYGLAPASRLMSYRVCPRTGSRGRAKSSDIAAALERAMADDCDLVNISMGSLEPMPEIPDVLQKAREAGMVVFAATGNDGQNLLRYPARYSHTMAVSALGLDDTFPADCPEAFQEGSMRVGKEFLAEFSNWGFSTDFCGPGVAVLSTYPDNRYAMMSGTSMATPFTSGMAARLLSRRPEILTMARDAARTDAIIQLLTQAARRVGWAAEFEGFGVVK
jgi:subtilisin